MRELKATELTLYRWNNKYSGKLAEEAKRLKALE